MLAIGESRALCAQYDPDLWFPDIYSLESTVEARRICQLCPVRRDCLDGALAAGAEFGVWGGTMPSERRALLHLRGRFPAPVGRLLQPHGTPAAYSRHRRHGEAPCAPCHAAELERGRLARADRAARAAEGRVAS